MINESSLVIAVSQTTPKRTLVGNKTLFFSLKITGRSLPLFRGVFHCCYDTDTHYKLVQSEVLTDWRWTSGFKSWTHFCTFCVFAGLFFVSGTHMKLHPHLPVCSDATAFTTTKLLLQAQDIKTCFGQEDPKHFSWWWIIRIKSKTQTQWD